MGSQGWWRAGKGNLPVPGLYSYLGFRTTLGALQAGAGLVFWMEGDCSLSFWGIFSTMFPWSPNVHCLPTLSGQFSELSICTQVRPCSSFTDLPGKGYTSDVLTDSKSN